MTASILVVGSPAGAVRAVWRHLRAVGVEAACSDPMRERACRSVDGAGGARPGAAVLVVGPPGTAVREIENARLEPRLEGAADEPALLGPGLGGGGTSEALALARWERQLRAGVECAQGLPTYVLVTGDVTAADGQAWTDALTSWLGDLGCGHAVPRRPVPASKPADVHGPTSAPTGGERAERAVLGPQSRLFDDLAGVRGPHECFSHRPAGGESPWTSSLLAHEQEAMLYWRTMQWLGAEASALASGLDASGRRPQQPYPLDATADTAAYHRWLRARGESPYLGLERGIAQPATPVPPPTDEPLFTVVVPCHRSPLWAFERCVSSVLRQTCPSFELRLCDDGSHDSDLTAGLRLAAERDPRVHTTARDVNGGISAATSQALEGARGRYVVFLDHDDELAPKALERLARTVHDYEAAHGAPPDLLYSDEDKIDESGCRRLPSFKTSWSPDLLLSTAYPCHVLVVRRQLMIELGGVRSPFDGAQDYDLMLRVSDESERIVHVPEVLYHWRILPGSAAGEPVAKPWALGAGRRALEETLRRRGIDAAVVPHEYVVGTFHVVRRPQRQLLVSAVIPFRDAGGALAGWYRSFLEGSGYDEFELILADSDSRLPETKAVLAELTRDRRVQVLDAPGPLELPAIYNRAAESARGELLLFLNSSVVARSPGWLAALVSHAEREEVGAVGARVLDPDGRVRDVGVAIGICQGYGVLQQGLPGSSAGYLALTTLTRNCSGVTGGCLMTRRSLFEEIGGLDPTLPTSVADVDYCLALREKGYLVVFTPLAELVHRNSAADGAAQGEADGAADGQDALATFRSRWRSTLLRGDPYFNPNLSRFSNHCRLPTPEEPSGPENWLSAVDGPS